MSDLYFKDPKDKADFYKVMYRLSCKSRDKDIDYTKMFLELDKDGRTGRLNLSQYETVMKNLDGDETTKRENDLILTQYGKTYQDRTFLEYPNFQRILEDLFRYRGMVKTLMGELKSKITSRKISIEHYLEDYDQSKLGYMGYSSFERLLTACNLSLSSKEIDVLFMIVNKFDPDTRIHINNFISVYNAEAPLASSPTPKNATDTMISPRVIANENVMKEISKVLLLISDNLHAQNISTFKKLATDNPLVKAAPDGTITKQELIMQLRILCPSIAFPDVDKIATLVSSGERVSLEMMDKLIQQARINSRSNSKHSD